MTRRSDALAGLACAGLLLGACGEAAPEAVEQHARLLAAGGRRTYATASHTCAISGGALRCWGASDRGQTGDGSLARRLPAPTVVSGLPPVRAVAAGGGHTCVSSGGAAHCFGDNAHGQGGVPRPFLLLEPVGVPGLPAPVTALAAGLDHSCAVAGAEASVWCWGRNEAGESGRPPPDGCREPFRVRRCSVEPSRLAGIEGAVDLALGGRHSCAISGGGVLCWGANGEGQLGDGTRVSRGRPAPVAGLPGAATAVAAGARHTCALVAGEVFCWGAGRTRPERWGGPDRPGLRFLAAGGDRTCAAIRQRVWCGDADAAPQPARGVPPFVVALAVSLDHACVLLGGGTGSAGDDVHCWGENDFGQLGTGDAPGAPEGAGTMSWEAWRGGPLRDADGDGRVTVACLGDSNTAPMPSAGTSWCERLPALLSGAFRVVNRGLGGATASDEASLLGASAPVDYTIENDAPDAALLSYGTNDLLLGAPVREVVDSLIELAERLRAAGALPLVALVPPVRSDDAETNHAVAATNDALRRAFPPERIVDFATGFGDAQLLDRVHFGDAGQALRAARAAEAIARFLSGSERPGPARLGDGR